jgi:hypothetical protein
MIYDWAATGAPESSVQTAQMKHGFGFESEREKQLGSVSWL